MADGVKRPAYNRMFGISNCIINLKGIFTLYILNVTCNALAQIKLQLRTHRGMVIFEVIGEVVGQIFVETIFYSIPGRIYEWITGRATGLNGYRTEQKKFIKFSVAKKFLLTWEIDTDHL